MTVAWYTSHRANGFFIIKEGWEYVMTLGIVGLAIGAIGPGAWSITYPSQLLPASVLPVCAANIITTL